MRRSSPRERTDQVDFTAGVSGTDLIIDINGYYVGSVQSRVSGTALGGSSIRTVNADGTVTCETDDDTTYLAGVGLSLVGATFSLNTTFTDDRYWKQGGNFGTGAGDYIGTTDGQPLEVRVGGSRCFRFQAGGTVIGGGSTNAATAGVATATIGGGSSESRDRKLGDGRRRTRESCG